MNKCIK